MTFLNLNLRSKIYFSVFFIFIFSTFSANAQTSGWLTDSTANLIDGLSAKYKTAQPGDTIFLKAQTRDKLLIRNLKGSPEKPITILNKGGIVNFYTESYYGISIINCRYIRLSGQGDSINRYGIQLTKVGTGAGIGVNGMTSDFEIDHVSIENCALTGIMAKTDPDCTFAATRETFTQFNTNIHDNYIANTGNEGMYIGSSYYSSGVKLTCNAKDTLVMPAILDNVRIYNNIVKNTGWDGIQVASVPLHCQVHHNTVINDSQLGVKNQMSGILLGGGSKCDCNNNLITDGKGDGIENHGLGGSKIYNNIIVNAGKDFYPDDKTQLKHGIFVSDVSVLQDSSFVIEFNDIINPKSDGIRFQSVKSKNNLIASNLIVNPGNYDLYQNGNTSFKGKDSYVFVMYAASDVQLKNNFFTRNIADAGISTTDYTLLPGSPLINTGYQLDSTITIDFKNEARPFGGYYDIGAMEYNAIENKVSSNSHKKDTVNTTTAVIPKPSLFPNPVYSKFNLRYMAAGAATHYLRIYTLSGQLILQKAINVVNAGMQQLEVNTEKLNSGTYICAVHQGTETPVYTKFIKL
ncbi:MAG: right-handed parallel beta-helix repeat-containing protein [Agriterribacter sp.]